MLRRRFRFVTLFVIPFLFTSSAHAVRSPDQPVPGEKALPSLVEIGSARRQADLNDTGEWRAFAARHQGWRAVWNERARTPHRALGPGIALRGTVSDAAGVDAAVRGFIGENHALFGGTRTLETVGVVRAGQLWHARYRETIRGVPVLFQDWEFRVDESGRLVAFGVDAYPSRKPANTTPTITGAAARDAAVAGLVLDRSRDTIEGGSQLFLLPVPSEDGIEHRLVTEVRIEAYAPRASWITLVDAHNGEVLWRHNRVRHAIGGTVQGAVQLNLPTDVPTLRPFARENVTAGPVTAVTNESGVYSAAASGTVTVSSSLQGPFVNVNRQDGTADLTFSTSATNPATVDITWTGGHDAERTAFYHVNLVHDWVKAIDPAFIGADYAMPCNVNINANCNAYWDGNSINFYIAGSGCPNTATMPDVVYHEYGHGVNDTHYMQAGAPFGMISGALHEGMADVLAALVQDAADGGKGFFGPGTILRTANNTNRWPNDVSGDPHTTGLIISGAFWDLREAVGLTTASRLAHFARYGLPDDVNDGIAMNEYFVEVLVADDDDANLANGTPHDDAIVAAFNAHGIGTGFWIEITHTPVADQPGAGPYPIAATVTYDAAVPIGSLAGSPSLFYSIDGENFTETPMGSTGTPNQYQGTIPSQTAAIVRYYIHADDDQGGEATSPYVAPTHGVHLFLAGPASPVLVQDLETDAGWTVGEIGDNATSGIWLRADPVGTDIDGVPVQPELDHTPGAGTLCYVTGNAVAGQAPGTNDVDNGKTTLTSGVFDATAGGITNPVLEYYRWYSNDAGSAPSSDLWRTLISNDGGASWVEVENTNLSDASWRRVLFFISDYVTPTANMRMRFIAEDANSGSLVEAAVDDLRLLGFPSTVDVATQAGPAIALSAGPSPFTTSTRIAWSLPAQGRVQMRVYDVSGRTVRELVDGILPAGPHSLTWDGRDTHGAAVSAGLYYVRATLADEERVLPVVRIR